MKVMNRVSVLQDGRVREIGGMGVGGLACW
jgi:hypothetical protein